MRPPVALTALPFAMSMPLAVIAMLCVAKRSAPPSIVVWTVFVTSAFAFDSPKEAKPPPSPIDATATLPATRSR